MSKIYEVTYYEDGYDDVDVLGTFNDYDTAAKLKAAVDAYYSVDEDESTCTIIERVVVSRNAQFFTKYVHYNFLTGDTTTEDCCPTAVDQTTDLSVIMKMAEVGTIVSHLEVYGYNEAIARERLMMMLDDLKESKSLDNIHANLKARFSEL